MTESFAIFETPIGACGIVWNDYGIIGVQLPEATAARTRTRLMRRFRRAREAALSFKVTETTEKIAALLRGEKPDFSGTAVDLKTLPEFNQRVYEITSQVPAGATTTYGEIAAKLRMEPQAARDVGRALGENPIPLIIPCHRVLAAHGKPGGYSGSGGVKTKLQLLTIEGAQPIGESSLFNNLAWAARNRR